MNQTNLQWRFKTPSTNCKMYRWAQNRPATATILGGGGGVVVRKEVIRRWFFGVTEGGALFLDGVASNDDSSGSAKKRDVQRVATVADFEAELTKANDLCGVFVFRSSQLEWRLTRSFVCVAAGAVLGWRRMMLENVTDDVFFPLVVSSRRSRSQSRREQGRKELNCWGTSPNEEINRCLDPKRQ